MTTSPSALTSHLGYWMRYVSNHVSHAFALKLDQMNVTVGEWVVMRELYDTDALSPSRLATQLGMTRGAVTKLADRLIAKAFVVREASAEDARAQTLKLTASGKRLVPKLAGLADRNDREFFSHLTREERAVLERVLKDIVRRSGLKTVPVG
jgi:DNA-binding MarR family transcriptional regulator